MLQRQWLILFFAFPRVVPAMEEGREAAGTWQQCSLSTLTWAQDVSSRCMDFNSRIYRNNRKKAAQVTMFHTSHPWVLFCLFAAEGLRLRTAEVCREDSGWRVRLPGLVLPVPKPSKAHLNYLQSCQVSVQRQVCTVSSPCKHTLFGQGEFKSGA